MYDIMEFSYRQKTSDTFGPYTEKFKKRRIQEFADKVTFIVKILCNEEWAMGLSTQIIYLLFNLHNRR